MPIFAPVVPGGHDIVGIMSNAQAAIPVQANQDAVIKALLDRVAALENRCAALEAHNARPL